MTSRYALEIIDRMLRDIMNNNLSFSRKIIVLGGNFKQLSPIKVHGTQSEIVNHSIKFSSTWKHLNFSLTISSSSRGNRICKVSWIKEMVY